MVTAELLLNIFTSIYLSAMVEVSIVFLLQMGGFDLLFLNINKVIIC